MGKSDVFQILKIARAAGECSAIRELEKHHEAAQQKVAVRPKTSFIWSQVPDIASP